MAHAAGTARSCTGGLAIRGWKLTAWGQRHVANSGNRKAGLSYSSAASHNLQQLFFSSGTGAAGCLAALRINTQPAEAQQTWYSCVQRAVGTERVLYLGCRYLWLWDHCFLSWLRDWGSLHGDSVLTESTGRVSQQE